MQCRVSRLFLRSHFLVVDGKGILDPLNARTLFSGTGEGDASELVMVAHRLPPEVMPLANIPHGTVQKIDERICECGSVRAHTRGRSTQNR